MTAHASDAVLLSVLLPVYNADVRQLEECWRSIVRSAARLRRSHPPASGPLPLVEVVCVDDGSADGGAAVAALELLASSVATESCRPVQWLCTRIVRLASNGGVAAALNAGLRWCRGEFVARMDADDLATEARFDVQVGGIGGGGWWRRRWVLAAAVVVVAVQA